jgi:LmbE family N-acetylglucosaminyl deacetylase
VTLETKRPVGSHRRQAHRDERRTRTQNHVDRSMPDQHAADHALDTAFGIYGSEGRRKGRTEAARRQQISWRPGDLPGDSVAALVITDGQNGPAANRERVLEQEAAAAVLDIDLFWGHLTDCAVTADAGTVAVIERVLSTTRADVVYVHAPDDSHQDHRAVAAATVSAARERSRVLHYRSPSTMQFHPTMFVDVTDYLALKITAVRCHQSQVEGSSMVDPEVVQASARFFGAQARVRFAEAFEPARFVWDLQPARQPVPSIGEIQPAMLAPPVRVPAW